MTTTRFTPKTFAAIAIPAVVLANQRAIKKGLRKAAEAGKILVIQAIDNAKPRPPVDTGQLRSSYQVLPHQDGWVLRSSAPHAGHMEHGTKAHTPPFAALLAWARRKVRGSGGATSSQSNQRHRQRGTSARPQRARLSSPGTQHAAKRGAASRKRQRNIAASQLARRAWLAIRKRGIKGRHFHATASQSFGALAAKHVGIELKRAGKA
jgi:hypothetical protein